MDSTYQVKIFLFSRFLFSYLEYYLHTLLVVEKKIAFSQLILMSLFIAIDVKVRAYFPLEVIGGEYFCRNTAFFSILLNIAKVVNIVG